MYFAHVLLKGEPKDFSVHNLFYYQHHSLHIDFFFYLNTALETVIMN